MLGINEYAVTMNYVTMIQKIKYIFLPASADDEMEVQIVSVAIQTVADSSVWKRL